MPPPVFVLNLLFELNNNILLYHILGGFERKILSNLFKISSRCE